MKAIFAMCLLQDLFYYIAKIFSLHSVSFTVFYYLYFKLQMIYQKITCEFFLYTIDGLVQIK